MIFSSEVWFSVGLLDVVSAMELFNPFCHVWREGPCFMVSRGVYDLVECGVSGTEGFLQGWIGTLVRFGPLFAFMSLYGLWFQSLLNYFIGVIA